MKTYARSPPFAAALLAAGPALADAVAPALDAQGDIDPPLAPFDEVAAATVLRLAPEAEALILHDADCSERRVRGGMVVVGAGGLRVGGGGAVLSETLQPCPTRVAFADGPTAPAATVFRGDGPPLALGPAPSLALVGPRRDAVTAVALARRGEAAQALVLAGGAARSPDGAAPRPAGDDYTLALEMAGAALRLAVRVADGAGMAALAP